MEGKRTFCSSPIAISSRKEERWLLRGEGGEGMLLPCSGPNRPSPPAYANLAFAYVRPLRCLDLRIDLTSLRDLKAPLREMLLCGIAPPRVQSYHACEVKPNRAGAGGGEGLLPSFWLPPNDPLHKPCPTAQGREEKSHRCGRCRSYAGLLPARV